MAFEKAKRAPGTSNTTTYLINMTTTSAWDNTIAAFRACLDEKTGEIDSIKFVAACEDVAHIYDALFSVGMMAKQLKSDITNSAGTVMKSVLKNPTKNATLGSLVENELKTNGRDKVRADRSNGVVGMLWAKRAVEFIMTYLELLGTRAGGYLILAIERVERGGD